MEDDNEVDVPPLGEPSEYTQSLYNPRGPGWPNDLTIKRRRHRIAFFKLFGVIIDPRSTLSYQQQIRQNEGPNAYGNLVFTMNKYDLYMLGLSYYAERFRELYVFDEHLTEELRNERITNVTRTILKELNNKWSTEQNWDRQIAAFYIKTLEAVGDVSQPDYQPPVPVLMKRRKNGVDDYDLVIINSLNVFEVISNVHYGIGRKHGSAEVEAKILKGEYHQGVPDDVVKKYKQACPTCSKTVKQIAPVPFVGAVKPIVSSQFRDRFQVDLVKMDRVSFTEDKVPMKYIIAAKDHFTGFCYLDALSGKRAELVAESLKKLFAKHGYPRILHTDNGGEFCGKAVVDMVKRYFPNVIMVHGRPRTPRDQGSVESLNKIVRQELTNVEFDFFQKGLPIDNWVELLPFVASSINATPNAIGISPYEHVFLMKFHRDLTKYNFTRAHLLQQASSPASLLQAMRCPPQEQRIVLGGFSLDELVDENEVSAYNQVTNDEMDVQPKSSLLPAIPFFYSQQEQDDNGTLPCSNYDQSQSLVASTENDVKLPAKTPTSALDSKAFGIFQRSESRENPVPTQLIQHFEQVPPGAAAGMSAERDRAALMSSAATSRVAAMSRQSSDIKSAATRQVPTLLSKTIFQRATMDREEDTTSAERDCAALMSGAATSRVATMSRQSSDIKSAATRQVPTPLSDALPGGLLVPRHLQGQVVAQTMIEHFNVISAISDPIFMAIPGITIRIPGELTQYFPMTSRIFACEQCCIDSNVLLTERGTREPTKVTFFPYECYEVLKRTDDYGKRHLCDLFMTLLSYRLFHLHQDTRECLILRPHMLTREVTNMVPSQYTHPISTIKAVVHSDCRNHFAALTIHIDQKRILLQDGLKHLNFCFDRDVEKCVKAAYVVRGWLWTDPQIDTYSDIVSDVTLSTNNSSMT